jgi:hypothetical protein
MPDVLIIRDQITESLYRTLRGGEHGLTEVPGLIRRAIEQQVWLERKVHQMRNKVASFPTFTAFIEAPPPEGLGATLELCERMIGDDADTLMLFRRATTGKKGAHHDNIMMKSKQGTSRAYTLDRLERERPDLFRKVKAGQLSANAAAIEAGFRKQSTPVERTLKLLPKLTRVQLRHLRARIDEILSETSGRHAA